MLLLLLAQAVEIDRLLHLRLVFAAQFLFALLALEEFFPLPFQVADPTQPQHSDQHAGTAQQAGYQRPLAGMPAVQAAELSRDHFTDVFQICHVASILTAVGWRRRRPAACTAG